MSDEHDDERPDDDSPDEAADESREGAPGDTSDESPETAPSDPADESLEGAPGDSPGERDFDDEEFGDELSEKEAAAPAGPAVLDMADLDALDDPDMSIEVEGLEEQSALDPGPEVSIDLSEFDAELEDESAVNAELDAARSLADELRLEKQDAEAQLATVRDQLRRTSADLENYRKRIERDRREEKKHAASGLVLKLLAVTDNFQRALAQGEKAAENDEVVAGFVDGVRLIESQFFDILSAAGLEPVVAEGSFDPAVHEALMQEPSADAPHLSILEVFERGYLFGGRLLRPARVKVAHNPDGVAPVAEDVTEDDPPEGDAEAAEAEAGGVSDDMGSEAADEPAADEPQQDSE